MSYTASGLSCIVARVGNSPAVFVYRSTDVHTDVDAADYFTTGGDYGMRVGDIVIVQKTDSSYNSTIHAVSAVSAAGVATINSAILA